MRMSDVVVWRYDRLKYLHKTALVAQGMRDDVVSGCSGELSDWGDPSGYAGHVYSASTLGEWIKVAVFV